LASFISALPVSIAHKLRAYVEHRIARAVEIDRAASSTKY
jgi:hypothetical protein